MSTFIFVLHVFVSLFLIVVVLLQTGKGASMGAVFGGTSNQTLFGSSGPAGLLTKLTALCAVVFMSTSLYLAYNTVFKRGVSIMPDAQVQSIPVPAPITSPTALPEIPAPESVAEPLPEVAPGPMEPPGVDDTTAP